MIDLILQMLELDNHIGKSKTIDIAKGVNKTATNFKDAWINHKRMKVWQRQQK